VKRCKHAANATGDAEKEVVIVKIMYNHVYIEGKEVFILGAVNVTVRIDEKTKREFDEFCENVGINVATAFTMYMKAVLRTRQLPFPVTDIEPSAKVSLSNAFKIAQEQSVINGTDKMTMDEIDAEIAAYRREKREKKC